MDITWQIHLLHKSHANLRCWRENVKQDGWGGREENAGQKLLTR